MTVKYGFLLLITIAGLSFLGFLDTTYLTILHYKDIIPPCTIKGCDVVLTSRYSTIGAIPISLLGGLHYLILMILSLVYFETKKLVLLKLVFFLALSGLLVSLILLHLQAFVLRSFCQYCLISELISTLLAFSSFFLLRLKYEQISKA